ncbi:MAG: sigma-70 family RNA polymerase sigma factor [Gammaproteobacteria bacterium]|nr:sigma-70 family RNA polymerase sigma factor [Gammaproteobacteria bacterium]
MSQAHYQPDQSLLLDLISRCALNDQQAFQALYQETSAAILGSLMRLLPNRDSAEDCLQEAFIQVWNKADQYHEGKGTVFGWMVTIARYRAIDCIRKERPAVDLEQVEPFLGETPKLGGDHAQLLTCLEQLPDESAEMILKSYIAGYTQAELSTSSGTPLGTVKSWMRRGLAALKSCLNNE